MIDYIVFGIVDNGVMILGAFTGYEVEKFLPERVNMNMNMKESLNLLFVAVEYYEMNHYTGDEESTERHKANVWKAFNNIKEEVTS